MEGEEEGGGIRLSKRFSDKGGEVDNKTKSGTAWSHSYLNQKPWHPLSYPNQRRKWIAEQIQAQHQRRTEEVAREARPRRPLSLRIPSSHFSCFPFITIFFFLLVISVLSLFLIIVQYAQEQEFFRQAALVSKKDKEKVLKLLLFSSENIWLFYLFISFTTYYSNSERNRSHCLSWCVDWDDESC